MIHTFFLDHILAMLYFRHLSKLHQSYRRLQSTYVVVPFKTNHNAFISHWCNVASFLLLDMVFHIFLKTHIIFLFSPIKGIRLSRSAFESVLRLAAANNRWRNGFYFVLFLYNNNKYSDGTAALLAWRLYALSWPSINQKKKKKNHNRFF